jgi:hypothetical protein
MVWRKRRLFEFSFWLSRACSHLGTFIARFSLKHSDTTHSDRRRVVCVCRGPTEHVWLGGQPQLRPDDHTVAAARAAHGLLRLDTGGAREFLPLRSAPGRPSLPRAVDELELPAPEVRLRKRHLCAVSYSKCSIYQDRVGTNMGKTQKASGGFFAASSRCIIPTRKTRRISWAGACSGEYKYDYLSGSNWVVAPF